MKQNLYSNHCDSPGPGSGISKQLTDYLIKTTFVILMMLCSASALFAQTVVTISSNGTFTVPAGVTSLQVEVWGTGGSGGGATGTLSAARGGGGGGGGAYTLSTISVTPGQVFTATIGALGSTGTGAGGAGGASTFISGATNVTANGGAGGAPTNGAGGAGGTGTLNGGSGGTGNASNGAGGGGGAGNLTAGSNGTTTALGAGGTGNPNVAPYKGGNGGANKTATGGSGNAGAVPGGGGGGGRGAALFGTATGGVGGSGQIVVTFTAPTCPATTSVTPATPQTGCEGFSTSVLTAAPNLIGTSGTPTIEYQWYYNTTSSNTIAGATLIAGATSSTYTPLSTIAEYGTRYYFCVSYAADNGCGQTNATQYLASNVVMVTQNTPPPSVVSPTAQTICNGDIVTLTGTSTGTGYVATVTTSILGSGSLSSTATSTAAALGPNPFQNYYGGTKQQMLITAAELTALGFTANGASITELGVYLNAAGALALQNVIFKMQNTSLTALTTTAVSTGWSQVHTVASLTPTTGVNNFVLTTPFAWTGGNLLIEINYTNNNSPSSGSNTATYDNTAYVSTYFYRVDNVNSATINSYAGTSSFNYSARNRLRFRYKNIGSVAPTWSGTTSSLYSNPGATVAYVAGTPAATVYAKPTVNTTYTATVSTVGLCPNTTTSVITVNQQPVFTVCPANMVVSTDAGLCESVVTYTATATGTPAPSLSYTFSGVTTGSGSGTGTGSTFNKGVTTVTITAANGCTPDAVCTFTVTVNDAENPVITCPATINLVADAGLCTSSGSIGTATATDNCGAPGIAASPAGPYTVGTTTVTWTATDASGNTATCTQDVIVTDTENPVITCPATANITTDAGLCTSSASIGTPTVTDNCSATAAVSPAGPYALGTTTVTWTATDASGNTATCTQDVIVTDNENPVITCPATANLLTDIGQCTSSASIGTATATDNCSTPVVTFSPAGPYAFGTTTVTWTATDAAGNISTCTQTVNVLESENPVITCPATANISTDAGLCTSSASIGTATATASCSTPTVAASPAGPYPVGTTTVTWTATDASGNTATCTQDVIVTDSENPVITCPATVTISTDAGLCTSSASIGTPTATDNCSVTVAVSPAGPYPVGTTTVTWTATDASGNTATCTQDVIVTDGENPVITCPATANLTADAGLCTSSGSIGTATATDNCASTTISSSPSGPYPVGTTTVTWTATDASGNTATCTQDVIVTDTENPVITCPATVTISTDAGLCTSSASIGTATATDNCSVTVAASPAGPYPAGTTTVTWTATDASGNTATCTQDVIVTDGENPVITCPSTATISTDAGLCTSSASIGTATATDNCSVTVAVSPAGPYPVGTTTVTWTATDASGNTATCTQDVIVTDNENPTATCQNISIELDINHTYTVTAAEINNGSTDNCGIASVVIQSGQTTYGCTDAGQSFAVTILVTDVNGNTSTCTGNVTVNDNINPCCEPPVITCPSAITVSNDAGTCGAVATFSATATGTSPTITYSHNSGSVFPVGVTTVTATATNECGTDACTFDVTVLDTENPVITCPATATLTADAGLCTSSASIGTATATDNCSATVVASPAGPYPVGTTTVTWTATDASGNTATCTQDVIVTDSENPVITCPATVTISTDAGLCTSSASIGTATATDNCSVTVAASPAGPYAVGTTTVTWTATDASGNTATCTQDVIVTDGENPVITCPATANLTNDPGECSSSASIGVATATDNCSTPVVTANPAGPYPVGTTSVTWTATDASGNTATCIQSVIVTDTENPTITCPADVTSCNNTPALGTAVVNDNCPGASVSNDAPVTFSLGTTVVTWTGTDASGNTITCTQNVTITAPPTATLSGGEVICDGGASILTLNFTGVAPWTYSINGGAPVTTSSNPEFVSVTPNIETTYSITSFSDANCTGTSSGSATITVSYAPPLMGIAITSSPTSGCAGNVGTVTTNLVTDAETYVWSAPAGTLINGLPSPQTTVSNSVTITLGSIPANSSGWQICVFAANGCGQTNTICTWIRGSLSTPAPISGSTVSCPNTGGVNNYSTNPVSGASSYLWTITGDATVSGTGTSASVSFGPAFTSGTLCVRAQLPCGYQSAQRCLAISNGTPNIGVMSGTFTVCPGTNGVAYSVPPSPGANTYTWTVPAGASVATGAGTNAVTINFGPTYNGGNICVVATSICGINSAPRCRTVASNKPGTPTSISGTLTGICGQNITYTVATVAGATSYTWTAPSGATLNSPNGNTTMDVQYASNFTIGNLCVTANNGCGSSSSRCVIVKGTPSNPGVISGPAVVCANESGDVYSVAPLFGASGYTWFAPAGSTIISGQGTTSIILDWGNNGGVIGVTATGSCGNSGTRTLNVAMTCKLSGSAMPGTEVSAYPNPVSNMLNVDVKSLTSGVYTLELMDLSGRVVYSSTMNSVEGMNSNQVDVSSYAKGMYLLSVKNSEGFAKQIRIAVE